jgi:hypothetical protein
MAKLTFERFICVEGTSESGDESPYFLTWVGNVKDNVSALRYTRQAVWNDNVPENPNGIWNVNEVVVNNFDLSPQNTLALAIMIEEDDGFDLSKLEATDSGNDTIVSVRETMANLLKTHFSLHSNVKDDKVIKNFQLTFAKAVQDFLHGDDLMDEPDDNKRAARMLDLTVANKKPEATFRGGGGKYVARYVIS